MPLIVATAQAAYAFAPAAFGLIREMSAASVWPLLIVAATIKLAAIVALLAVRKARPRGSSGDGG